MIPSESIKKKFQSSLQELGELAEENSDEESPKKGFMQKHAFLSMNPTPNGNLNDNEIFSDSAKTEIV